jgi:hypothetical protein
MTALCRFVVLQPAVHIFTAGLESINWLSIIYMLLINVRHDKECVCDILGVLSAVKMKNQVRWIVKVLSTGK